MRFKYSDGGRSKSKRPKQKNDCSVRAYAIATGESYDEAFDKLKKAGRKNNAGPSVKALDKLYLKKFWSILTARPLPKVKDVLKILNKGHYIIQLYDHVFAINNGVVKDTVCKEKLIHCEVYRIWVRK